MNGKNPSNQHAIIKAKELAEAIKNSEEFKDGDVVALQSVLTKCNRIISESIKINYEAVCQPRGGCCG
ncbi:MAG: hypothetical protein WDZ62_01700 [Candidatus Pacearchaeota archaeon]